jgi:hypothetical protein
MEVQSDSVSVAERGQDNGQNGDGNELTITIVTYPTCGKNLASDPYANGISLDA